MADKALTNTRKIVLVGLLAALTAACSALRIKVPADIVGTSAFHLGNIMCALSGILLGPWLGGLAAGIGSFLYDMTNPAYIDEAWLTFLMKGAYGLFPGLVMLLWKNHWGYVKAGIAAASGAVAYAAGYLFKTYYWSGILKHGLTHEAALVTVFSKIPATVFNAAVAIIFAPILAVAIRKALEKNRLTLD